MVCSFCTFRIVLKPKYNFSYIVALKLNIIIQNIEQKSDSLLTLFLAVLECYQHNMVIIYYRLKPALEI